MGDFLELTEKEGAIIHGKSDTNGTMRRPAQTQDHISTKPYSVQAPNKTAIAKVPEPTPDSMELTRLHIHVRKALADALLEEVFTRKRDPSVPNKLATQRVIIEQALETYLKQRKIL